MVMFHSYGTVYQRVSELGFLSAHEISSLAALPSWNWLTSNFWKIWRGEWRGRSRWKSYPAGVGGSLEEITRKIGNCQQKHTTSLTSYNYKNGKSHFSPFFTMFPGYQMIQMFLHQLRCVSKWELTQFMAEFGKLCSKPILRWIPQMILPLPQLLPFWGSYHNKSTPEIPPLATPRRYLDRPHCSTIHPCRRKHRCFRWGYPWDILGIWCTIWLFNIAMENPLRMEVLMGKSSINGSFSIAISPAATWDSWDSCSCCAQNTSSFFLTPFVSMFDANSSIFVRYLEVVFYLQ
jgi:hypothetical protein